MLTRVEAERRIGEVCEVLLGVGSAEMLEAALWRVLLVVALVLARDGKVLCEPEMRLVAGCAALPLFVETGLRMPVMLASPAKLLELIFRTKLPAAGCPAVVRFTGLEIVAALKDVPPIAVDAEEEGLALKETGMAEMEERLFRCRKGGWALAGPWDVSVILVLPPALGKARPVGVSVELEELIRRRDGPGALWSRGYVVGERRGKHVK